MHHAGAGVTVVEPDDPVHVRPCALRAVEVAARVAALVRDEHSDAEGRFIERAR